MNPIQIEILIENAINDRLPSADARYHLCYWEKKIQCCPITHTRKPHKVFHAISRTQMRDGFVADEWRTIVGKIHTYLEGLRKCHELHRQSQTQSEKS